MSKLVHIFRLLALTLGIYVFGVSAQETAPLVRPQGQPTAPFGSLSQPGNNSNGAGNSGQVPVVEVRTEGGEPTTASGQDTAAGTYSSGRSFLLPSVSLITQLRSDSPDLGYGNRSTQSYLTGRLGLRRVSGRSDLLLDYMGGGVISTGRGGTNSAIHALDLSRTVIGRRSSFLLGAAVSYLPESSFGFGELAGFSNAYSLGQPSGALVITSASLSGGATPDQTILTARAQRLSGTVLTRLVYKLTPRSSWNASGSYGLLHFYGAGYVNSSNFLFQTGYDYQASQKNTISISYRFNDFRFANVTQIVDEHYVSLSLARQVNDKLRLHIGAGPSLAVFRAPLSGSPTQIGWSVTSGLTYQIERMVLALNYDRLLTGGSGVLTGAQTNQFRGTVERALTRMWQGSVALGYARNQGFAQTVPGTVQVPLQSWYGTAGLSRRLSTGSSLSVGYGIREQHGYGATIGPGPRFVTHQISLGLSWGSRPISLQ